LERGSARYHDGYGRLRSWAYRSLESYKVVWRLVTVLFKVHSQNCCVSVSYTWFATSLQHELLRVLYPVFIHCFMDLVAKGHLQEGMKYFFAQTFNNNY